MAPMAKGGKISMDWHRFEQTMGSIAPNTPVFSDIIWYKDGLKWKRFAGTTNWNLLDTAGFSRGAGGPSTDTLNSGNRNGKKLDPFRMRCKHKTVGWFYHTAEDEKVKRLNSYLICTLRVLVVAQTCFNVPPTEEVCSMSTIALRLLASANCSMKILKQFCSKSNKRNIHDNTLFKNNILPTAMTKHLRKHRHQKALLTGCVLATVQT